MTVVRQSTFANGEIAPTLHGRTDFEKYHASLALCRNFFTTKHGAAMNRPGTVLVAPVYVPVCPVRLIPFIYESGGNPSNFMLEFGQGYIRALQNGAVTGQALVGTPFQAVDLAQFRYTQIGKLMILVHPSYAPHVLTWDGAAFTLDTLASYIQRWPAWTPGEPMIQQSSMSQPDIERPAKDWQWAVTTLVKLPDGRIIETAPQYVAHLWQDAASAYSATATYAPGAVVTYGGHTYRQTSYAGQTCTGIAPPTAPWALMDSAGQIGTTGRHWTNAPDSVCLYSDRPITIDWSPDDGLVVSPGYTIVGYRVYRGRNKLYGWVGDTDPTVTQFKDDGQAPDFTQGPPKGTNPFTAYPQYPQAVAFHQQRLWLAVGDLLYGSKIGDFYNFDPPQLTALDDGSVIIALASKRYEPTRHLVSVRSLLVLTAGGEWSIGAAHEAITPTSPDLLMHGQHGSAAVEPVVVDGAVVYSTGGQVRELLFNFATDSYGGVEISVLASHLFENRSILDWTFAQSPFGILWGLRDDGVLLGCTLQREHEVTAWHQHATADGDAFAYSVATIPEGGEDRVYIAARRGSGYCIERFSSRLIPRKADGSLDLSKAVFLDSAKEYAGAAMTTFAGLDHLEGRQVMIVADDMVAGPYTVLQGVIDITADLPDGVSWAKVGLPYLPELETLDLFAQGANVRSNRKNVRRVDLEVKDTRGFAAGLKGQRLATWGRTRTAGEGYGAELPKDGLVPLRFPSNYDREGRVVVQQPFPLPITIVGLGRAVDVGGE
jgi:hypothetical protein